MLRLLSALSLLACLTPVCGVLFTGFKDNGNVNFTCGPPQSFDIGNSFLVNCTANQCPVVTYTWNPDLNASGYGITLDQHTPATLQINPTSIAIAKGSVSTTITAQDGTGQPASGSVTIFFVCPLRFAVTPPDLYVNETVFFSANMAQYMANPLGHTLSYSIRGLVTGTNLLINSQTGVFSGIPNVFDAVHQQPIPLTLYVMDTVAGTVVHSTFNLRVLGLAGLTFARPIPTQNATEGVLATITAADYFDNPNNFHVNWTITSNCPTCSFAIDNTGTITIVAGVAELLASSRGQITVTVTGIDERGNIATSNSVVVNIVPLKFVILPIPPLPDISCGSICCAWNPVDFVSNPSSNPLVFTLQSGLPGGTAIKLQSNGTLTGIASFVDVRASPLTLHVSVNNGQPSGPTPMPLLTFSVTPLPAPSLSTVPMPTNRNITVGDFWTLDVTPFFVIPPGSGTLSWTIGAPSSSLSIDFTGKVSGTLTDADYLRNPVYSFNVTVSNRGGCGGGQVTSPANFFSFGVNPNWPTPHCIGVPSNIAVCEGAMFAPHNYSGYCRDPKNSSLVYSIVGLPNGTGLVFNPITAVLSGVATLDAANSGTASLTICATNIYNITDCTSRFSLTFQRAKRPPIADPPIPSPVTAILGQRFIGYFNFHFYEPDWQPLIYSVAGLPVGSGLGIGPITGIFSGTPNQADFRASPLVLSIFASNEQDVDPNSVCAGQGQGGIARADLIIVIEQPPSLPVCNPIPADANSDFAQVGMFWARDVSMYFKPGDGFTKLEYALRSLPRGSGLSIDPRSGVVSGVLSQQDLLNSPETIVVAATNGAGMCQSMFQLTIGSRVPRPTPLSNALCPVSVQNIFPQNAAQGQYFTLNVSKYFFPSQPIRLTFSSTGLPQGSGFSQDPYTGMFSGSPSAVDLRQQTLTIVSSVSCGGGQPVSTQWQLFVNGGQCTACNGGGGCQQICTVTNPSTCVRTCGCNPGQVLNPDGLTCSQGGGCDIGNGGCQQICTVQAGRPVCSCQPNWFLNSDGKTCSYNPCGTNNGGCQQICTPSGSTRRCDCQTGTLNPDLQTCSSSGVIVTGTIPPGLVLGCQMFMFDFSTAFKVNGGGALTFKMTGLAPNTGFALSSSGLMSGTPTLADCNSAQPMTVTVTASLVHPGLCSGATSATAVMFLSTFCQTPSACGAPGSVPPQPVNPIIPVPVNPYPVNPYPPAPINPYPPAPVPPSNAIPLLWGMVCVNFNYNLSPYFVGGQGNVQFSCLGLPQNTGLMMSSTGTISGTPNSQDCATAPITLTVTARDTLGRESKSLVTIKFQSCDCQQQQNYKGLYPPQTGGPYPSYPQPYPQPQPGYPQPQPGYPQPTGPITNYVGTTSVDSTASSNSALQLHTQASAQCGQPFFLDTSEYFRVNNLRYAITGLPPGSGLRLSDSGVLSGTPNSVDAGAVNPLMISVTGTDRTGAYVTLTIFLQIMGNCGLMTPSSIAPQTNFRSGYATPPPDSNTGILPVQNAPAGQVFKLDMSRIAFTGFTGKIRYQLLGLPANSGLTMSPEGVISGTPSAAACQLNPTNLTVRAVQDNKIANTTLFIFLSCPPSGPATLTGVQYPTATGTIGELLYYDCSPFVTATNMSTVTFSAQGLNLASHLLMSPAGVLSGVPSAVDLNSPPLLIVAKDTSGNVVQNTLRLNIVNQSADCNSAPVFIPLDVVIAPLNKPISINIGQRFYDQAGDNLTFSILGLSNRSGLKFNAASATLSGTPSQYDVQQFQPVRLISFADDGHGSRTEGPIYIAFSNGQNATQNFSAHSAQSSTTDPVSLPIKRQVATQGQPFLFGVASSFVDQDLDVLSYSLEGLPAGSGLGIDRMSGLISGTPCEHDALAKQPIVLTVTVTDGQGGSCSQMWLLTVLQATTTMLDSEGPSAHSIPNLQIAVGQTFFFRLSYYFYDPNGDNLTYAISGLPGHSGLHVLANTGILVGVPTNNDKLASPELLKIVATDPQGRAAQSFLNLTITASPTQTKAAKPQEVFTQVSDSGVPKVVFPIGASSFFKVSTFFPVASSVTYNISGLPAETGLSLNRTMGMLWGSPTLNDAAGAAASYDGLLSTTVVTVDSSGNKMSLPLLLQFLSPFDQLNHAPFARAIPAATVAPGQKFSFDVGQSFSDPDGDGLVFAAQGLPTGTGFSIVPSSGIFFGVPSQPDVNAAQPIVITITATDNRGGSTQENLLLTIGSASGALKSCHDLGWPVSSSDAVCARAVKYNGGCPTKVTYSMATTICKAAGARLCSSQELSDSRFVQESNECDVTNQRVWTSSVCAFDGEMITEGSSSDFLSTLPKECHFKNETAGVKCCANNAGETPQATEIAAAVSDKTCDELVGFVTSPSSPNKAVCATATVKRGKGKAQCSGLVSLSAAKALCQNRGARLCTADELSQDVGNDQLCGYSNQRVWSSTACPLADKAGQMITQAGASAFLGSMAKACSPVDTLLPTYCCADQRAGEYFQDLQVVPGKDGFDLSWDWKVYPHAQVSLRLASASKGGENWITPQTGRNVRMGGGANVKLTALTPNTRYSIRITPINDENKLVHSQAVVIGANTLK